MPDNAPADQAEAQYVDEQATEWADPREPNTFPSGATVEADRRDANAEHDADESGEAADQAPTEVDPHVKEAYEEATERGANQQGEGRIG